MGLADISSDTQCHFESEPFEINPDKFYDRFSKDVLATQNSVHIRCLSVSPEHTAEMCDWLDKVTAERKIGVEFYLPNTIEKGARDYLDRFANSRTNFLVHGASKWPFGHLDMAFDGVLGYQGCCNIMNGKCGTVRRWRVDDLRNLKVA